MGLSSLIWISGMLLVGAYAVERQAIDRQRAVLDAEVVVAAVEGLGVVSLIVTLR